MRTEKRRCTLQRSQTTSKWFFLFYGGDRQITTLLECGSDPTIRDEFERLPYPLCVSKNARQAYRDYRGAHPDQYNWGESAVPEPITEEQNESKSESKGESQGEGEGEGEGWKGGERS